MINNSVEYRLISRHYGSRVAQRSQVPLINHIDQGLVSLDIIDASQEAKRAFCMHPLWQQDDDLGEHSYMANFIDSYVAMLTMEYRSVANEYLSNRVNTGHVIRLSPLVEVNHMLIADKVQNRKDFITHHRGTHPRSCELDQYFMDWMQALDISEQMYQELCQQIDQP
jgi:hypothetical protein